MGEIDHRIVYLVVAIMIVVPLIRPLMLPVAVGEPTKAYHEAIASLPEGSVIIIQIMSGYAGFPEIRSGMVATAILCAQHNIKWVSYTFSQIGQFIMEEAVEDAKLEQYGAVYGEDYVMLGFVPGGGEAAEAAVAEDLWAVLPVDIYGTPLSELPMMQTIHSHEDIDFVLEHNDSGTSIEVMVRQWYTMYGVKCLINAATSSVPTTVAYYPSPIVGYLMGSRGGAELETMMAKPGWGLSLTDSMNLAGLSILGFIILGNASMIHERIFGSEEEED